MSQEGQSGDEDLPLPSKTRNLTIILVYICKLNTENFFAKCTFLQDALCSHIWRGRGGGVNDSHSCLRWTVNARGTEIDVTPALFTSWHINAIVT